jgi:hypothetical protein
MIPAQFLLSALMMNKFKTSLKSLVAVSALFFSISAYSQPNLTPYKPAAWSDKIVVSTGTGTSTDSSPLTTGDTLYVDWAVANLGGTPAGSFSVALYVDGVFQTSWGLSSLANSSYTYALDYSIGSLSAGSHTIQITADSGGTVVESNESDNTYTKTITLTALTAPAPTLVAPANGATGLATTPAFSWTAVTNVTGYRIIAATSAADLPTDPTTGTNGPSAAINATPTNTTYTPTIPLLPGTTYYWEVHGRNGAADIGAWSSVRSFTTAPAPSGLTIVPNFDSTITSDPQAATIEATINAAIAAYQSSFSDPVTVNITFHKMASGLGQSSGVYYQVFSYSSYRAALAAHATTPDDTTALAHLPGGGSNPVTGDASMNVKLALARALGFTANPPAGQPDGTISLNLAIMNLSGAGSDPSKYSLFSSVSHEIDEVLGMGSTLDSVKSGSASLSGPVSPEDLFRYDAGGARNYTTNAGATSFFSIDGTTDLAQFNQVQSGDLGDWYSFGGGVTPQVQDAFTSPNVSPVLGVELRVLDAIGYTRVLPQASIVASAGTGGVISPAGSFNKNLGSSQPFTATPNASNIVSQWLVDAAVVQTGGSNYTLANIQTNHTVQVTFASKTNQTITFGALPGKNFGDPPFSVSATASSGLPVSFSIFSGPATISGTNVTITAAGNVVVRASQAGNTNYNSAANVDQSFTVAKANQTITFGTLTNRALGETFAVAGTASSGLPVSFSIFSGPATIAAGNVTVTNTGVVVVRAAQAGNTNYNTASNVDQAFTVFPPPSLTVAPSGQNVVLSWTNSVPGFTLLGGTNLAQIATWTAVAPSPVIVNGRYVVTNTTSGPRKFYQLKK